MGIVNRSLLAFTIAANLLVRKMPDISGPTDTSEVLSVVCLYFGQQRYVQCLISQAERMTVKYI